MEVLVFYNAIQTKLYRHKANLFETIQKPEQFDDNFNLAITMS